MSHLMSLYRRAWRVFLLVALVMSSLLLFSLSLTAEAPAATYRNTALTPSGEIEYFCDRSPVVVEMVAPLLRRYVDAIEGWPHWPYWVSVERPRICS